MEHRTLYIYYALPNRHALFIVLRTVVGKLWQRI